MARQLSSSAAAADDTPTDDANTATTGDYFSHIIKRAHAWARIQGHTEIRSPHLFAAVVGYQRGQTRLLLEQRGADVDRVILQSLDIVPSKPRNEAKSIVVSENVQAILKRAVSLAEHGHHGQVGEWHLCQALFEPNEGTVHRLLKGLHLEWLCQIGLDDLLPNESPQLTSGWHGPRGVDLVQLAHAGRLPKVERSQPLLSRLMQRLASPAVVRVMLVRSTGHEITSIVDGLADWISGGVCPPELNSCRLWEYRGQSLASSSRWPEESLAQVQAVLSMHGDDIVFVDDFHCIMELWRRADVTARSALDRSTWCERLLVGVAGHANEIQPRLEGAVDFLV